MELTQFQFEELLMTMSRLSIWITPKEDGLTWFECEGVAGRFDYYVTGEVDCHVVDDVDTRLGETYYDSHYVTDAVYVEDIFVGFDGVEIVLSDEQRKQLGATIEDTMTVEY